MLDNSLAIHEPILGRELVCEAHKYCAQLKFHHMVKVAMILVTKLRLWLRDRPCLFGDNPASPVFCSAQVLPREHILEVFIMEADTVADTFVSSIFAAHQWKKERLGFKE